MFPNAEQITEMRYREIPKEAGEIVHEESSGNFIFLLCQKQDESLRPWVFIKGSLNDCGVARIVWLHRSSKEGEVEFCYEQKVNTGGFLIITKSMTFRAKAHLKRPRVFLEYFEY